MPTDVIDPPASEPITELTDREQAILDAPSDVPGPDQTEQTQQTTGDDQPADDVPAAQEAGEAKEDPDLSESELRDIAQEQGLPTEGSAEQLEQTILGKEGPPADSRMDQLIEVAKSYEIDEQDARSFATPEALELALRVHEKKFLAEGRQQQQQQQSTDTPQQDRPAAQPQPAKPADSKAFKLEWGEDGIPEDDQYAANMQGLHGETQRLQTELAELRTQMAQQQELEVMQYAEQELITFDGHVDHLDADLFGGTKEQLSKTEVANRRQLWESAKILQAGMASRGIEVSLTPQFIERAQHHAFADQLQQTERKRLIERVRKQSNRRTGSGSPSRANVNDSFSGDLADTPEIVKAYDGYQEDNGAV